MKHATLVGTMCLLLAAFSAPSACGQKSAAGSFVPKGAVWKKNDTLLATATVEEIHFSPDGRRAVLANHQRASVWDWKAGRETHFFGFAKGSRLSCLAVSADGKRLASAHVDNTNVLVWDLTEGVVLAQLKHAAPIRALAFAADGTHLVCGGGHPPEENAAPDYYVQLWKLAGEKPIQRYLGLSRPVRTLAFAADSIIAEDDRGAAVVWGRDSAKVSDKFDTHAFVTPLGIVGKANALVGYEVGEGRFLTRWDLGGKKERLIDMSPEAQPSTHRFWSSPDGKLAATSHPAEIKVWDLHAKQHVGTLPFPRDVGVQAVAFTPDGSEVVVALSDKTLARFESAKR